MNKQVHILVTCLKPELIENSILVFKTLRVGFPTATVHVHLNNLGKDEADRVIECATKAGCRISECNTNHGDWIYRLVNVETQPFYILDTDVIFYDNFERFEFQGFAGWRIPEWYDLYTKTITRSRLHTSLMYIDPAAVKDNIHSYLGTFRQTKFNPPANLFNPISTPFNGRTYFHDTCSLLYHAIGGQEFTAEQLDCYTHLHFGTFEDDALPIIDPDGRMKAARDSIRTNPDIGRGAWRQQMAFYEFNKPDLGGENVIAAPTPDECESARKWNTAICNGNQDAMLFCDLWYSYCHAIDDLIDSMRDGRPRMSREQILETFANAAVLYNSRFFVQHREHLFPIVLHVTNIYANSVAWELSPQSHRRAIADVFRTCGNYMYDMVAMICGGYRHMRNISDLIKERDWLGQHDSKGNPT